MTAPQLHASISVANAHACIIHHALCHKPQTQRIELEQAVGRILAQDVRAPEAFPPFESARMDGYALSSADFNEDATLQTFKVIDHVRAGASRFRSALPHSATRIMTGAPIPPAYDAVIKLEDVQILQGDGNVGSTISCAPPQIGQHITKLGERIAQGDTLAHQKEHITASMLGLFASVGIKTLTVYRRPRVALISLGDELIDYNHTPRMGQIRNSNTLMLASLLSQAGAEVEMLSPIPDALEHIVPALQSIAERGNVDMLVTTGGSAHGDFDFIARAMSDVGTLHYRYVNMTPAYSHIFATLEDDTHGQNVLMFGLPGTPGAALCACEMMVRPALMALMQRPIHMRPQITAKLTRAYLRNGKPFARPHYLKGRLARSSDGSLTVDVSSRQHDSALQYQIDNSYNCIAILDKPTHAGEEIICIITSINEENDWIA